MSYSLNETHSPRAKSWVKAANVSGAPCPIQNLPLGVFRDSRIRSRIGIAIGDEVLDLYATSEAGLLNLSPELHAACRAPVLNNLMALKPEDWSKLRHEVFRFLHESTSGLDRERAAACLIPQNAVSMEVPCRIGDYTDFYAGIFHAENVGSLFRPENPLLPNYKWVPIAYHGRSSSIVVSGTPVSRPSGQTKPAASSTPVFGPGKRLDYELELAFYVGHGNEPGSPVSVADAEDHVFGVGLLNDWSARDIQAWEYQPLGPFLAKNFATTVSPWIITMEALAPFRCPGFSRPSNDPQPLPYLFSEGDQQAGGMDVALEIFLLTPEMKAKGTAPVSVSRTSSKNLYWTAAQCIAHHTSNGCNLRPGDLLGSGTISGPGREQTGSLLELTRQGAVPLELPNGESRTFLEDGDEVIIQGWCRAEGYVSISFGECRGRIANRRAQVPGNSGERQI